MKKINSATRSFRRDRATASPALLMNTCMLFFFDPRGRYDDVEGFTIFDLLLDTIEPIFLCQVGSYSGRRPVYLLRDAFDLGIDLFAARLNVLERGYLIHYECPAYRLFRTLALRFADGLPVYL